MLHDVYRMCVIVCCLLFVVFLFVIGRSCLLLVGCCLTFGVCFIVCCLLFVVCVVVGCSLLFVMFFCVLLLLGCSCCLLLFVVSRELYVVVNVLL